MLFWLDLFSLFVCLLRVLLPIFAFFLNSRQLPEKKSLCVSHTLWIKLILIWYAGCLCAQFHKWEAHGDSALEQLLPDGPLLSLSPPLFLRPPLSTTESSRRWAWLTLRANTWSSSSIPWICKYFSNTSCFGGVFIAMKSYWLARNAEDQTSSC